MNKDLLKHYELMYILSARMSEKEVADKKASIEAKIKELSDKITSNIDMGIREFAYKVKAQWKGYYMVITFIAESISMDDFRKWMDIDTDIMRYVLLNIPEGHIVDASKKPIAQAKKDDETKEKAKPRKRAAVKKDEDKATKKVVKSKSLKTKKETVKEEVKEKKTSKKDENIEDLSKKIDDLLDSI